MAFKLVNAASAKVGTAVLIDGVPCIVRSADISKTGKHGHAKVRMEAVGLFDGKKKVIVIPGHERMEVPEIRKLKAQVVSIQSTSVNIMDLESFETIEVDVSDDMKKDLSESDNVEYWNVEGRNLIKRKL